MKNVTFIILLSLCGCAVLDGLSDDTSENNVDNTSDASDNTDVQVSSLDPDECNFVCDLGDDTTFDIAACTPTGCPTCASTSCVPCFNGGCGDTNTCAEFGIEFPRQTCASERFTVGSETFECETATNDLCERGRCLRIECIDGDSTTTN